MGKWSAPRRRRHKQNQNLGNVTGDSLNISNFAPLCPAGYYIAIRVGFAYPVQDENTLPPDWVLHYTRQGYMPNDPLMHWVYTNDGACRWSDIDLPDPRRVMREARRFGLRFGAAISLSGEDAGGQRSFGIFARHDREYEESEIARLTTLLETLHVNRLPPRDLTQAELQALRMIKDGLLMKEIAALLGVSEAAVKQRLRNAKTKLRAKTSTHAATMATSYGLI